MPDAVASAAGVRENILLESVRQNAKQDANPAQQASPAERAVQEPELTNAVQQAAEPERAYTDDRNDRRPPPPPEDSGRGQVVDILA
ncbi:MAG: hypothetical protein KDE22_11455 [Rhodobacterales bacterium]|nr:hypothetical protein [Rhodobacterales bacterium]